MWVILVAGVLLLGSSPVAAWAEEEPPTDPARPLEPCDPSPGEVVPGPCSPDPEPRPDPSSPPPTEERLDIPTDELRMPAARGHRFVEETMTSIVARVDAFFGDPAHPHLESPTGRLRIRTGLRVEQGDPFQPEASIVADLRLPSLDKLLSRAHLFVSGGEERETAVSGTEDDTLPPRFGSASVRGGGGAAELRFDAYRDAVTLVDLGAGLRFDLPPPPYLRARAARAFELGLGVLAHGNQTVFWQRREGFGESTRVDVERVFGPSTIARTFAIATMHELSRGLETTAEVGLQQALGRRTGVYVAAGLDAVTRHAQVDRYRVYSRLRRDVHRGWLFAELEPEVFWPLLDDRTRRPRVFAATFRLEVHFRSLGG